MGPHHPGRCIQKNEREPVEHLGCAKPDVFVGSLIDRRLELFSERLSDDRMDTVGTDDEIDAQGCDVRDVGLESQVDAHFGCAIGENLEQILSARRSKAVPVRDETTTAEMMDLDLSPMLETVDERGVGRSVGIPEVSNVSSEKTTPKPKASPSEFRS